MKNTAFRRTISMLIALTFVLSCASSAFAFNIGTRRDDIFSGKNQFGEGIVQEQHEVTSPTNLLNEDGTVKEPGWARTNLFTYNRESIAASPYRIKEWDYYQVSDGRYLIQFTVANIGLGDGGFITIKDMKNGGNILLDTGVAMLNTPHILQMPRSSAEPSVVARKFANWNLTINYDGKTRHITAKGTTLKPTLAPFEIDLTLTEPEDLESITMAIPYQNSKHFFLTNKIDSMPVNGYIRVGDTEVQFTPDRTFGILDWGRGVWDHDTNWIWSNGSGYLPDGSVLGWELTWGIGDPRHATETALFYNGKAHKLGRVTIDYDPNDLMKPWTFHEENGRFEMTFTPFYDNHSDLNILELAGTDGHQVHGMFDGIVTLDDGTVIPVHNFYAFCEQVNNRW